MALRYALNRLSLLPGTSDMYKDGKADYPNDVIEKVFSKTLLSYATPPAPPRPTPPCPPPAAPLHTQTGGAHSPPWCIRRHTRRCLCTRRPAGLALVGRGWPATVGRTCSIAPQVVKLLTRMSVDNAMGSAISSLVANDGTPRTPSC